MVFKNTYTANLPLGRLFFYFFCFTQDWDSARLSPQRQFRLASLVLRFRNGFVMVVAFRSTHCHRRTPKTEEVGFSQSETF